MLIPYITISNIPYITISNIAAYNLRLYGEEMRQHKTSNTLKEVELPSKFRRIVKWTGILVGGYIVFNILCHFHCLSMAMVLVDPSMSQP
jgi:hypothetical protein